MTAAPDIPRRSMPIRRGRRWRGRLRIRGCVGAGRAVGSNGGPTQAIVCAIEAPPIEGWTRVEVGGAA